MPVANTRVMVKKFVTIFACRCRRISTNIQLVTFNNHKPRLYKMNDY
jgi:hypothetical protein